MTRHRMADRKAKRKYASIYAPERACDACGTSFKPQYDNSRFCSRKCILPETRAANLPRKTRKAEVWWINSAGYKYGRILEPDGSTRRIMFHRLVMERALGRRIPLSEDVHHIDGNKLNNSIENLQVLPKGEHTRLTNSERTYRRGYRLKLTDERRRELTILMHAGKAKKRAAREAAEARNEELA